MENHKQDYEINLGELFDVLKQRWLMIVATTLTTTIIAAIISIFVLVPKFETSTTMLVNYKQNQEGVMTYNDVIMSQKLVNTYSEIIKSRLVVDQVKKDLRLSHETSAADIANMIAVSPVGSTEIIKLTVKHEDKVLATKLANNVADIFQEEIKDLMEVDSVKVIDKAIEPLNPVSPNKTLNIMIGGILGLVTSVVLAFGLAFMDRTMKTPQDIERHLGLPLIGAIPDLLFEEGR